MTNLRCAIVLSLLLSLSLGAQEPDQGGPDTIGGGLQEPAAVARGAQLFSQKCAFCHGTDARGRSGPDLVRSTVVLRDVKGNLLIDFLRSGRPQQGMPAFSLPADQLADLVAFLHSRTHAAANRFTYVIQGLMTGDAKAGEAWFNGEGKCAGCHSPQGDLAHIAAKYDPVELQSRFLSPPSPNDRQLLTGGPKPRSAIEVTVKLRNGESVSGLLLEVNAFDVSLVDSNGWFRSFERSEVQLDLHDPLKAHRDMLPHYTDKQMHNMLAYLETLK